MTYIFLILSSIFFLALILIIIILSDQIIVSASIQNIYSKFISLERNSVDSQKVLFNSLLTSIRNSIHCQATFLYFLNEEESKLGFTSITGQHIEKKKYLNTNNIKFTKKDIKKIKSGKWTHKIEKKLFISEIIPNEKLYKRIILLPVSQEKNVTHFVLFLFIDLYSYLRAMKLFVFNKNKYIKTLKNLITYIQDHKLNQVSIMMETIKDYAFITTNNKLEISTWNKGAELIFEYSIDEVMGHNLKKFINREYNGLLNKAIKSLEKKDEAILRITFKGNNNTLINTEMLIKQNIINHIKMGYYILIKDISKDEVLKRSITNKSMITRSIVENSRDGIILLNKYDKIIFFNERIKNITDSDMAFLGMDVGTVFQRKYGEVIKEKIKEIKNTKIEFNAKDFKMGNFWYNLRFFPIKNEKKVYDGAIIFFVDNTLWVKHRKEMEEKNYLLEEVNQRLIDNLKAAHIMQMSMIPQKKIRNKNFRYESVYILSDEVGGDFYFVEEIKINRKSYYLMVLTDVSGHGIGASMLSVFVKEIYNEYKETIKKREDLSTAKYIKMLNKKMFDLNLDTNRFITAFFMILDMDKMAIKFSSAGHPHMPLIREDKPIRYCGLKNTPPIGVVEDYDYREDMLEVKKGDKFILYTDGLLDVFSNEVSYYSYFNNFLIQNQNLSINEFKNEIELKINEIINNTDENRDDITVVIGKIL